MGAKVIGDRYEILSPLGKGGMAKVYRSKDRRLLRDVAIKILSRDGEDEEEGRFYFHREARAIAALRHHNIVQIYDYSGPEENPTYIVMELVDGGNIDEMLMTHHPLPEDIIVAAAYGLASALQHAHENGVIHRDIKPQNVMVEPTGRLLLTDFGIAKPYRDASMFGDTVALRQTQLFGTPDFMAPEQILEEPLGPHTDIFAFGSLVYCLATNTSPFDHADTVEVLRRVVDVDYLPLRKMRPLLSGKLDAIVSTCIQADAAARPTASKIAGQLEDLLFEHRVPNAQRNIHQFLRGERATGNRPVPAPVISPDESTDEGFMWETTEVDAPLPSADPPDPNNSPTSRARATTDNTGAARATTDKVRGARDLIVSTSDPRKTRTRRRRAPPRRPPIWIALGVLTLVAVAAALVFAGVTLRNRRAASVSRQVHTVEITKAKKPTVSEQTPPKDADEPATATEPEAAPEDASAGDRNERKAVGAGRHSRQKSKQRGRGAKAKSAAAKAGATKASSDDTASPAPEPAAKSEKKPADKPADAKKAEASKPDESLSVDHAAAADPVEKKPATGKLTVVVRPWGQVTVDGVVRGKTPKLRVLELTAGRHMVTITHPAYGMTQKFAIVRAGQNTEITFDLRNP